MKPSWLYYRLFFAAISYSPAVFANDTPNLIRPSWVDNAGLSILASNTTKKSRQMKGGKRRPAPSNSSTSSAVSTPKTEVPTQSTERVPRMTIEANPLGLLLGVVNFELNIKWDDRITVGPVGAYVHYGFLSGFGAGGSAYYYFDKLFEKRFVTATIVYSRMTGGILGFNFNVSGFNLGVLGGYKWLWPSFVASVGAGLQINSLSVSSSYTGYDGDFGSESAPSPPISTAGLALMGNIGIPIY